MYVCMHSFCCHRNIYLSFWWDIFQVGFNQTAVSMPASWVLTVNSMCHQCRPPDGTVRAADPPMLCFQSEFMWRLVQVSLTTTFFQLKIFFSHSSVSFSLIQYLKISFSQRVWMHFYIYCLHSNTSLCFPSLLIICFCKFFAFWHPELSQSISLFLSFGFTNTFLHISLL